MSISGSGSGAFFPSGVQLWTPASLPDFHEAFLYAEPYVVRYPEPSLADLDMEASGTTDWPGWPGNSGTITKDASDFYEGTKSLKFHKTNSGGSSPFYCDHQSPNFPAWRAYYASYYYKTDGSYIPQVRVQTTLTTLTGAVVWTKGSTNNWFGNSDAFQLVVPSYTNAGDMWWDNVVLYSRTVNYIDAFVGSGVYSSPSDQYKPSYQGNLGGVGVVLFGGVNNATDSRFLVRTGAVAADYKYLHDGTGMTMAFVLKKSYQAYGTWSFHTSYATCTETGTNGINIQRRSDEPTLLQVVVRASSLNRVNASVSGLNASGLSLVIMRHQTGNNWEVWVDGVKKVDVAPTGALSSSNPMYPMGIGGVPDTALGVNIRSSYLDYYRGHVLVKRRVNDAELALLGKWMAANMGGTWT